MTDLFREFPDDETAEERFVRNKWPDGRRCTRCGCKHACVAKRPEMPYRCSEERRFTISVLSVEFWRI